MDFHFPPEAEAFRQEVREFLIKEWPLEYRERYVATTIDNDEEYASRFRDFQRKLGQKGFLSINFPSEYGGQGRSIWERYVFIEEITYANAPYSIPTVDMVGATLVRLGSESQKRFFLPRIISGEIICCLGYTEADAGTDLASLKTRAVADGDSYIINGSKIYTSNAEKSDYCWLAARTDLNVPPHKGISLFLVDMKTPGISVSPLWTMDDGRVNEVHFEDVRVGQESLVGEPNKGWYYISTALDFERVAGYPVAKARAIFEKLVRYVKETAYSGRPLKDDPDVRSKLAQLSIELETAQLLVYRGLWLISQGKVPFVEASIQKVFNTQMHQRVADVGLQILGAYGQLQEGSKWAPLRGILERACRSSTMYTFGAGSNEIQRNLIALRGLGLPKG